MSTTKAKISNASTREVRALARILEEGYGPGAWHGPDLKAALADVSQEAAFWRPQPERHNIAEIALHHAYYVHSVREKLAGKPLEPFMLEGSDWFKFPGNTGASWHEVTVLVEKEYSALASSSADVAIERAQSLLPEDEHFNLILGITCHAVYHAGQIQLIKRLREDLA